MLTITFNTDNINVSAVVGDIAYGKNSGFLGQIVEVGNDYIKVDTVASPTANDFIYVAKPAAIEKNSVKGYYAELTFRNTIPNSNTELFAVTADVKESSK
tara:strand:+ start:639 stop:938 length:300 start_codon:yes stop_codon:yes gene_type:complete